MAKYKVEVKRDFGGQVWLVNGKYVNTGFVVTDGICNIMPGAAWFSTIEQALFALKILVEVNFDAPKFWEVYRARRKK